VPHAPELIHVSLPVAGIGAVSTTPPARTAGAELRHRPTGGSPSPDVDEGVVREPQDDAAHVAEHVDRQ
jgi:hypothetical protein